MSVCVKEREEEQLEKLWNSVYEHLSCNIFDNEGQRMQYKPLGARGRQSKTQESYTVHWPQKCWRPEVTHLDENHGSNPTGGRGRTWWRTRWRAHSQRAGVPDNQRQQAANRGRGQPSQHQLRMGTQAREPPDGADLMRGPSLPIPQPQGSRPANAKISTQGAIGVLAPASSEPGTQADWPQISSQPHHQKTGCRKQGCRPLLTAVSVKGRPFASMCWCTSQYE